MKAGAGDVDGLQEVTRLDHETVGDLSVGRVGGDGSLLAEGGGQAGPDVGGVSQAGRTVGQLLGAVLLLPGDPGPPIAGHHHRVDHVDLVPGDVGGPGHRLEGRPLELESDGSTSIDQQVEPAARAGESEAVVAGTAGPVHTHPHSDDSLPGRAEHSAPDDGGSPLVIGLRLGVTLHTFVSLDQESHFSKEPGAGRRRRLPEQDVHRVGEVNAHDVLLAGGVGAAVAVPAVHQTV